MSGAGPSASVVGPSVWVVGPSASALGDSGCAHRAAPALVLWLLAVALLALVFLPVAGWATLLVGLLLGTLLPGAWLLTGLLLVHAARGGSAPADGR